ncbi:acetylcholinesterase-1-like [Ornithodoros turicata]|uniref:acetylcholinesterase-1-like n=1 Tax=Ornithodoros turicata TaxID=34597 RepID=UPI0031390AFE
MSRVERRRKSKRKSKHDLKSAKSTTEVDNVSETKEKNVQEMASGTIVPDTMPPQTNDPNLVDHTPDTMHLQGTSAAAQPEDQEAGPSQPKADGIGPQACQAPGPLRNSASKNHLPLSSVHDSKPEGGATKVTENVAPNSEEQKDQDIKVAASNGKQIDGAGPNGVPEKSAQGGGALPDKQEVMKDTMPSCEIFNFTTNDYLHFDTHVLSYKDDEYTGPNIREWWHKNKHVVTIVLLLLAFIAFVVLAAMMSIAEYLQWNHVKILVKGVGVLKGVKSSRDGRTVYSFLGISYAKPTWGSHRFRRPEQAAEAKQLTDATTMRPACPQGGYYLETIGGATDTSEDCLHVNIWTPCIQTESPDCRKTVIVFLYGEEFLHGSNNVYEGSSFAAIGDVVVVAPNFRLGVFGFLSTGTKDAPGNLALYDQEMAVRWVLNHIEPFGGNSSDVVLMGSGTGAWSIGALLFSSKPFWRQHFRKFIIQSESPFRRMHQAAPSVSSTLKCPPKPLDQLLLCLQSLPAEKILNVARRPPFTYEPSFGSELFPYEPWRLASMNPVQGKDILLGTVADEGSRLIYHLAHAVQHDDHTFLPSAVSYMLGALDVQQRIRIIQMYRRNATGNNLSWAHSLIGDVYYVCPVLSFAEHLSWRGNRVRTYVFNEPENSVDKDNGTLAGRFADLHFLFRAVQRYLLHEVKFGSELIDMWAGFAKSGSLPLVENKPWPVYTAADPRSVAIDSNALSVIVDYKVETCATLANFLPELNAWKHAEPRF